MSRVLVYLALGFACLPIFGAAADSRAFYSPDSGYYEEFYRRPLPANEDYRTLKDWVKARKLTSVDAVLRAFAGDAYYRQYLSYAVLMHDSDSRQMDAVSPRFPRIILHHPQSRLILALTGNPDFAARYAEMEIIELRKDDRAFDFHLADFSANAKSPFVDEPSECRTCHGTPSRPIWGTYRLWTGAYGGFDDKIETPAERALWDDFEKSSFHKGRYALLQGPPPRYHTPSNIGPRVNDMLNQVIGDLNARRVAATITESPAWPVYRRALVDALKDCHFSSWLLPKDGRASHQKKLGADEEALASELARSGRAEFATRVRRYAREFGYQKVEDLDRFGPVTDGGLRTNFDDSVLLFAQAARVRLITDGQSLDPLWNLANWSVSFDRHHPNNFSFTGTEAPLFDWLDRYYLPPRLQASKDPSDRALMEMDCAALEKNAFAGQ